MTPEAIAIAQQAPSYDEPYTYERPTSRNTVLFSAVQYAHLLVLRGRIEDEPEQYKDDMAA